MPRPDQADLARALFETDPEVRKHARDAGFAVGRTDPWEAGVRLANRRQSFLDGVWSDDVGGWRTAAMTRAKRMLWAWPRSATAKPEDPAQKP